MIEGLSEHVANACLRAYALLPNSAKPSSNEWTVLAGVVLQDGDSFEAVALGTGSKCIGQSQMSPAGDILNDSHAEVMARRGFLRYLYDQMELAQHDKSSLLAINDEQRFTMKPTVSFHLFGTRPPCGDATIVTDSQSFKNTGAKLIENLAGDEVDRFEPRLTRVRRKPGRGDPTLSASCSDKFARWQRVGIQGALLDMLLPEPIKLTSIVIGGDGFFCVDSLKRALVRNDDPATIPLILKSEMPFLYSENEGKTPSFRSIVWCKVKERPLEIAVEGRRLGTTKKNRHRSLLCITKKSLFGRFLKVCKSLHLSGLEENPKKTTYKSFKSKSSRYYTSWNIIKQTVFKNEWPEKKRELLEFYAPDEGV